MGYLQTDDGKYGILDPMSLVNKGNPIKICLDLIEIDGDNKIYKKDRKMRKSKDLTWFKTFYKKKSNEENENQMKLDI